MAVPYEDWRTRVEKELRGAPFESLVSTLPGGIEVRPLYHGRPWEDGSGSGDDPRGLPGSAPFVRGARPAGEAGGWLRCARIDAPDPAAAKAALAADLRGGCDALWLEIGPRDALDELLGDVDLERVAVFLDAGVGSLLAAAFAFETVRGRGADPGRVRFFLGIDPIGTLAGDGALPSPLADCETAMALFATHCTAGLPRSRAVTVSAVPWHEAGATPVQELGWALATLVRYLRRMEESGLDLETAAGQIALRVAVGRDLFGGIAKLRALRWLWAKALAACGLAAPPAPFVHAVGSDLTLARRDPWTNALRATTEVFAAVAGGADAITASAYDRLLRPGDPAGSRLGRRLARNAQHVLAEEAHLGKVADPAGGSYYLETLTEELARRAWDEMRRVEGAGGIAEHLRSGRLREEAEAAWRERRRALVDGSEPVLGVGVYPPPAAGEEVARETGERVPRSVARRAEAMVVGESVGALPRHRLAEPYEDEGVAPPAAAGGVEEEA